MQIIKITPNSFKIILTKEDLERCGAGIFENQDLSDELLAEIIEKTNRLYGSPFGEGAVDAEFFESKDGGGELFISSAKHINKSTVYLFSSQSSDNLPILCKRIMSLHIHTQSTLYFESGLYFLAIFCNERSDILLSILKEYGISAEINRFKLWLLEEHASVICEKGAIERLSQLYK